MTQINSRIIGKFNHKSINYDTVAFISPTDPWTTHVEVRSDGKPVAVTYPDGYRASIVYSVSLSTRMDMYRSPGIDAISHLAETAEADIRKLV